MGMTRIDGTAKGIIRAVLWPLTTMPDASACGFEFSDGALN